jgi:maltose O-acetyltransferase
MMTPGGADREAGAGGERRRSLRARAWSALRGELQALHPRLILAGLLVRLLPQHSFQRLRTALYRAAGISIGPRSLLAGRLELIGTGPIASRLSIGADCMVNAPFFADLTDRVEIGSRVAIGHHLVVVTSGHAIGPASHRAGPVEAAPVVVEDGAWIGACVTLLPGARVGAGSVVGAGSLVVGELPPCVLAVGRPARVVRRLEG